MRVRPIAGVLAAMTALALSGCSSRTGEPAATETSRDSGPQTVTIEVSYDELLARKQISRSVKLAVDDFLQVSLGANPSTGYRWTEKMLVSDPKVMTQTGHEVIAPAADRPGAPGRDVWVLQATGPGNTTVSTTSGQPWEGGEKEAWVFSVNVDVG